MDDLAMALKHGRWVAGPTDPSTLFLAGKRNEPGRHTRDQSEPGDASLGEPREQLNVLSAHAVANRNELLQTAVIGDGQHILGETSRRVISGPQLRVAMSTQIKRDHAHTIRIERRDRRVPILLGGGPSVYEQDCVGTSGSLVETEPRTIPGERNTLLKPLQPNAPQSTPTKRPNSGTA
jgi:hypothetical protein